MSKIFATFYLKTLAASFLLLMSAFAYTQYNHYKDLRTTYLNSARRISQGLSSQFSFYYHNAQNIAYNRSVRRLNRWESREYFNNLAALYPHYDMIVLSDAQGNFVASNTIGAEGEELETRKLRGIKFPLETESDEDLKKGFLGSSALDFSEHKAISNLYGFPKVGMRFTSLVRSRSGKVLGQVTTFINHKWAQKELSLLAQEFLPKEAGKARIYLLNKNKKVLASNLPERGEEGPAPLEDLPFKIETANFSSLLAKGKLLEGVKSFSKFAEHPFFAVSTFDHQNFLQKMGWTLAVQAKKASVIRPLIKNLQWFLGAFALFALVGWFFKSRTAQRLEEVWQRESSKGASSFSEALEREKELLKMNEALETLGQLKEAASRIQIPCLEKPEKAARSMASYEFGQKARAAYDEGLEELQVLEAARTCFSVALRSRKNELPKEVLKAWKAEKKAFDVSIEKARDAFGRAHIRAEEMVQAIKDFEEEELRGEELSFRFARDRKDALKNFELMALEADRLEEVMLEICSASEETNKKAA